ncbi:rhodanese-like domain-containing protein [Leptolyngbya sp. KIOST-1]|uniref:rhodanese-like domain-containing protein n=1 Tax=Leptolyngbya sp. KIOST-1 TaxID=1229172 RepID=UPI00055AC36B|nr:rhodanese-like domain-containing protein [Leptolyngbya sp. KIOST-1]
MLRFFNLLPKPSPLRPQSRVYDLKERLDWGEPALTIIDVRDRADFNQSHITGAISMPTDSLLAMAAQCFEVTRDLYIYSNTDDEATAVAEQLRQRGFSRVAIVRGGVAAWKAAGFPVEVVTAAVA